MLEAMGLLHNSPFEEGRFSGVDDDDFDEDDEEDDDEEIQDALLSEYERLREANVERNIQLLIKLNFLSVRDEYYTKGKAQVEDWEGMEVDVAEKKGKTCCLPRVVKGYKKWACHSCTFLNPPSASVCKVGLTKKA